MTPEAGGRLIARKQPAHRLGDSGRVDLLIAHCDVEPVDRRVVAHVAFIELSIAFQHESLCAYAEDIADGKGDSLGSVRNAVQNSVTLALNCKGIETFTKRQASMRFEQRIF